MWLCTICRDRTDSGAACFDACRPVESGGLNVIGDSLQPDLQTTDPSLRRRWLFLLPAVFITYSLAYLDRANFGFGAAAGLAAPRCTSPPGQSSLLAGSLLRLATSPFSYPALIVARKIQRPVRFIFFSLIPWGILSALTGIITTFWALGRYPLPARRCGKLHLSRDAVCS